jgi:hypothetical protein
MLNMTDFNEVTEHDVVWGEMCVSYVDASLPGCLEPILARGIFSINSIIEADGYAEKHSLLYPDYPNYADKFLHEALNAANRTDDRLELEDYTYTPDDETSNIAAHFFDDPDMGPADVSRWAHQSSSRAHFLNNESRTSLHEWGYVMWDRNSIDRMRLYESEWAEPDEVVYPTEDVVLRDRQRKESLERRSQMYMAGRKGWWAFDDESKVVSPGGKDPRGGSRHCEGH